MLKQLKSVVKAHHVRVAAIYAGVSALSLLVLAWVLNLGSDEFSLNVPLIYYGDGFFNAAIIKGIIDNGWYLHNSFLGAPHGLYLYDFPMVDSLHLLAIKVISLFTHNDAAVMNLFYFATFPLTAITSLFVFRRLLVSFPVAVAGSLLFTFLPYHIFRGEGHLFLSGIYIIPLSCLAILRVGSDSAPFVKTNGEGRETLDSRSLRSAGYLVIAFLTASAGIYYAFFTLFFLVLAGVYGAYTRRSVRRLMSAAILIGLIVIGIATNLMPTVIYQQKNGKNEAVAERTAAEAEIFSGTITQLVMPVSGHRLDFIREFKADVNERINLNISKPIAITTVNENDTESLGLIGTLGVLLLLGWLGLARRRQNGDHRQYFPLLDDLSVFNIFAILLGTFGGLGLILALTISTQIRSYNRISVFIGFFAILAMMAVAEILQHKYAREGNRRKVFWGITVAILAAGILDQTTSAMAPAYNTLNQAFASDDSYFRQIEQIMPAQSLIFQLPYEAFPESTNQNLRGYLHTQTLHWSYGIMKGREGDLWQKNVASQPARRMLAELSVAGFTGLTIERTGYADKADALEKELTQILGIKPLVNDENSLLFFDLRGYQLVYDDLISSSSPGQIPAPPLGD